MRPDLSDEEVDQICAGLIQNAAKVRFLQGLGLTVARRPNGRPLVNRAHFEQFRGFGRATTPAVDEGPNWNARRPGRASLP